MNSAAKAWKDPAFRATLNDTEAAALPAHPVGLVELDAMILDDVRGASSEANMTTGCCPDRTPISFRTCLTCEQWTCRTCWGC